MKDDLEDIRNFVAKTTNEALPGQTSEGQKQYSCEICKDKGAVVDRIDENGLTIYRRCICATENLFRVKLGRALFEATRIQKSGIEQLVDKNLFLNCSVEALYAHLRFTVIYQGLGLHFRLASDHELLSVFLGNNEEEKTTRVFLDPQLLVLQLGLVGYSNKALPGVVSEIVQLRLAENKPTWLSAENDLSSSDLYYSEVLRRLVDDYFDKVRLGKAASKNKVSTAAPIIGQQIKSSAKNLNDIASKIK